MPPQAEPSFALLNAQKELARRRKLAGIKSRLSTERKPDAQQQQTAPIIFPQSQDKTDTPVAESTATAVRIFPSLATYCLDPQNKHNDARLDGGYRLYKLLQALDTDGRGWLALSAVKVALCDAKSETRVFGRRRLNELLRRGEGLFWRRTSGKRGHVSIRLVGRKKLAAATCGRLSGREVEIPLAQLQGSQADANAALYAAFHASRTATPVSRAALVGLTGCSPERQRAYEKRAKIATHRHVQIIGKWSDYLYGQTVERDGIGHAYKLTDLHGKVNRHAPGAAYVAAQLPNSFEAPKNYRVLGINRTRAVNRANLCTMGSEGNDDLKRVFYDSPGAAVKTIGSQGVAFWKQEGNGRTGLWMTFGTRQVG